MECAQLKFLPCSCGNWKWQKGLRRWGSSDHAWAGTHHKKVTSSMSRYDNKRGPDLGFGLVRTRLVAVSKA